MKDASPPAQDGSHAPSRIAVIYGYFATVATLGFVTGILMAGRCLIQYLSDHFVNWNIHSAWMPLVSESLCLLALFLLIAPLALLLSQRSFDFVMAGYLGTFAALLILSTLGFLALWAILLLSLGVGVQLGRSFQAHSQRIRRTCRIAAPLGFLVTLAVAGTVIAWRARQEQQALAGLAAPPSDAPNVLLVVWDTVRADYVATFDETGAPTPHLDRLADRGMAFDRAIAPASWTLPSHASMFTGLFPQEFTADWYTAIPSGQTMLAEVLRDRGYQTAGFVANTRYCGCGVGMNQGFIHYEDYKVNWRLIGSHNLIYRLLTKQRPEFTPVKPGAEITDDFLRWLDESDEQRPFFAFLNYMDAHTPYLPETNDGRPLTPEEISRMQAFESLDPEQISEADHELARKCYRAQITALDAQLGRLLESLERRDALDDTIVIVVSDHGEHFGEHGLYYHGNSVYKPLVHVPLVVSCPGDSQRGTRVSAAVSLRNIGATILDCIGLKEETPIRGQSLIELAARFQENDDPDRSPQNSVYAVNSLEAVKSHKPETLPVFQKSVGWKGRLNLWVEGPYHLIRGPGEETELYNIVDDPLEEDDLTLDPEKPAALSEMLKQLDRFLQSHPPHEVHTTPEIEPQALRGEKPQPTGQEEAAVSTGESSDGRD